MAPPPPLAPLDVRLRHVHVVMSEVVGTGSTSTSRVVYFRVRLGVVGSLTILIPVWNMIGWGYGRLFGCWRCVIWSARECETLPAICCSSLNADLATLFRIWLFT